MYKYGERILVKRREDEEWRERYFTFENEKVFCVEISDEEFFVKEESFKVIPWKYHKPLSQKYDSAEMMNAVLKEKVTGMFYSIIKSREHFFYTLKDEYKWSELDKYFEVVS